MTPVDPLGVIAAKLLPYVAGVFLTVSLFVWRIWFVRFFKRQDHVDRRQDDIERRLSTLESESVGKDELRHELKEIEAKIEEQGKEINIQLSSIYKLLIEMAGKI